MRLKSRASKLDPNRLFACKLCQSRDKICARVVTIDGGHALGILRVEDTADLSWEDERSWVPDIEYDRQEAPPSSNLEQELRENSVDVTNTPEQSCTELDAMTTRRDAAVAPGSVLAEVRRKQRDMAQKDADMARKDADDAREHTINIFRSFEQLQTVYTNLKEQNAELLRNVATGHRS